MTPEPQTILVSPSEAAIFLVLGASSGAEEQIREWLADCAGIRRSVGFRVPEAELSSVIGIGADLWDRLFGFPRPAGLHRLPELAGPRHTAVSTPGDLLVHIRAHRFDLCFELAQRLTDRLAGAATVIDEVHGFRSFDERDLLGFVDGTENPEGAGAAAAALIGEEDPGFAGGSYVVVQKYVHDLAAWDELSVEAQERVIGRTKLSDIELDDDVKPPDSHVALTVIEDETGEERQILRFNMPFGRVGAGEFGTYFIGYAADPGVIEQMLRNMFLGSPPGNTDRILEFSTALTGTLFFVPDAEFLDDPPAGAAGASGAPVAAGTPASNDDGAAPPSDPGARAPADGSLRIGSLRAPPRAG